MTMKTAPVAMPTLRAPTPVSSVTDAPTVVAAFGVVPARPESRLPSPSTVTAPCTARKSTARARRHETRWMATAPLTVRTEAITATNRKAGSSAQKDGPKSRSKPAHSPVGRPTHGASTTRPAS